MQQVRAAPASGDVEPGISARRLHWAGTRTQQSGGVRRDVATIQQGRVPGREKPRVPRVTDTSTSDAGNGHGPAWHRKRVDDSRVACAHAARQSVSANGCSPAHAFLTHIDLSHELRHDRRRYPRIAAHVVVLSKLLAQHNNVSRLVRPHACLRCRTACVSAGTDNDAQETNRASARTGWISRTISPCASPAAMIVSATAA